MKKYRFYFDSTNEVLITDTCIYDAIQKIITEFVFIGHNIIKIEVYVKDYLSKIVEGDDIKTYNDYFNILKETQLKEVN